MSAYQFPRDREKFLSVVHNLDAIQPPPSNVLRLLKLCKDPQSSTAEIISLIESQAAIAARVLAVANSPLYGYTRQIGSISHAVVILGIRNILQLALSFGASEVFMGDDKGAKAKKDLYRHSLGCALVARSLSEQLDGIDCDEAFVAGMLHDIGKLALIQLIPEHYTPISEQQFAEKLQLVEREELGISHAAIGGICALRWGLPLEIKNAIENHHELCDGNSKHSLAVVVRVADWITHREGIGCEAKTELDEFPYADYSVLNGLREETIQWVVDESREQLQVMEQAI